MGRIRKTLAWITSPGGDMHGLVRAESSAETAAREQADEMRKQNRLLEAMARNNGALPLRQAMACCEQCRAEGCDQAMPAVSITRVRTGLICDCAVHHATADQW